MGVAVAVFLVIGFVQGFLFTAFVDGANRAASLTNGTTSSDAREPTSGSLSGGAGSLVAWDTWGSRAGTSPAAPRHRSSSRRSPGAGHAADPGLRRAGLRGLRAGARQLAVRELERTGAFDRKVLAVMTSTGTGWIDPQTADALEFLHNGDTAEVSMQYSFLPSWISFLVDRSKAADASATLNDAVLARWRALPVDTRPELVVFGESLGSFGTEEAYSRLSALTSETDGALLVGPPTPIRSGARCFATGNRAARCGGRSTSRAGWCGSPTPRRTSPNRRRRGPARAWSTSRTAPTRWCGGPGLPAAPPRLARGRAGRGRVPRMRWYPVVTFCQLVVDLVFANDVPAGHGHRYGTAPAAGWAAIVPHRAGPPPTPPGSPL